MIFTQAQQENVIDKLITACCEGRSGEEITMKLLKRKITAAKDNKS